MSLIQPQKKKEQLVETFEQMWDELNCWREKHPKASFDEIAAQVTPRRRELMGQLLAQLACQQGNGEVIAGQACPDCGQSMTYKGTPERDVAHLEGETELVRAYYYCAHCEDGFFPPG